MSEVIKVEYALIPSMAPEALDFFIDELSQGNTILVSRAGVASTEITNSREWDAYLLKEGFSKPPVKKDYRI
jgi:hypothetical protein